MTEKALAEAKAYVEKSLKDQAKLGYSRPPKPVINRAVASAAPILDVCLIVSSGDCAASIIPSGRLVGLTAAVTSA